MGDRDCACLSDDAMDWLEMRGFDGGECWAIQWMVRLSKKRCRPGVLWLRDDEIAYKMHKRYRFVRRLVDKMFTERVLRARRDHLNRRVYEFAPTIVPVGEGDARDPMDWEGDWGEELTRTEAAMGLSAEMPDGETPDIWQPMNGMERSAMLRWRSLYSDSCSRPASGSEQAEALRQLRAWVAEGRSTSAKQAGKGWIEDWFRQREEQNATGNLQRNETAVAFSPLHSPQDDDEDESSKESFEIKNSSSSSSDDIKTQRNGQKEDSAVAFSSTQQNDARQEVVQLLAEQGIWKRDVKRLAPSYTPELVQRFIAAKPDFTFETGKWAAYLCSVLTHALEGGGDPAESLPEKYLKREAEEEARRREEARRQAETAARQAREAEKQQQEAELDAEFAGLPNAVQQAVDAEAIELWRTVIPPDEESAITRYVEQRRSGKVGRTAQEQFLPYRHAIMLTYRALSQQPVAEKQQGALANERRLRATAEEQQEVRDAVRRPLAAKFPDLSQRIKALDPKLAAEYQRLTKGEWLRRAEAERPLSPEEEAQQCAVVRAAMENLPDLTQTEENNAEPSTA